MRIARRRIAASPGRFSGQLTNAVNDLHTKADSLV
jgi:hypothetical protein